MSFKDCVNTKDCVKIQTDIDDVKNSISGITNDVETINETTIPAIEDEIASITETTIPAIQDDISDLDDRVTALENGSSTGGNWVYIQNVISANLLNQGLGELSGSFVIMLKDVVITFKLNGVIKNIFLSKGMALPTSGYIFDYTEMDVPSNFDTSHLILRKHYYMSTDIFFRTWSSNWKYTERTQNINIETYNSGGGSTINNQFTVSTSPISITSGDGTMTIIYKE